MRGLGKFLFGFIVLTSTLLLYVHERVEVLRVSYRIQKKSVQLSQTAEEFRRLNFEVSELRSPQSLENKLKKLSLPLTLPKQIQVLRVSDSVLQPKIESLPLRSTSHNLLDFLGQWIQVAQARTEQ